MTDPDPIQAFFGGSDGTSEEVPSEIKNSVTKNFKKTKSQLRSYSLLGEGNKYNFSPSKNDRDPVSTTQTPLIPFMISLVPPREFPSGDFKEKRIPAPQQIKVEPTALGSSGNVISVREETGSNVEEETESEEQESEKNVQGASNTESSPKEAGIEKDSSSGLNSDIKTQVPVSNLEANSGGEAEFDKYLSSLEKRYRSFQKSAEDADKKEEQENTEQTRNRPFTEDEFSKRNEQLQESRRIESTEEYIRQQALLMRDLPPLMMYINPSEFSISYEHVVSDGAKTRDGHIIEHWGLDQPTIDASGKIGAFYIDQSGEAGGLTEVHRRQSAAFQSFMNLFMTYRNNAYIYNPDNTISRIGSVRIFYDGTAYIGSFDDFSITESEDQPFTLEYSFSFTVRFEQSLGDRI